jgi:tellurite resistance protein
MSVPGTKHMGMGALWAIGGTVVTVVTLSAASGGGTYVVAYGAIGIGAIQFVIGLVQYMGYQSKSPDEKDAAQADVALTSVVQAMVAMSVADGNLDDSEIEMITGLYQNLTGQSLPADDVRSIAASMEKADFSITDALENVRGMLDTESRELVLKAAYLVLIADGVVDENEEKLLNGIADSLQFSGERYGEIIDEIMANVPDDA